MDTIITPRVYELYNNVFMCYVVATIFCFFGVIYALITYRFEIKAESYGEVV